MNRQAKVQKTTRLYKRWNVTTKVGSALSNRTPGTESEAENEAENEAEKKKLSLSWKETGEIA